MIFTVSRHPLIDAQHRQLFEIANRLTRFDKTGTNNEVVSETLSNMTDYAGAHFKTEEAYLLEIGCPHLKSHKKQHREFRMKILELCQDLTDKKNVTVGDIHAYLIEWLSNHILHSDRICIEYDKKNTSICTGKR